MVLDIHHHQVNHTEEAADVEVRPKNDKDVRSHADFIDAAVLMRFLRFIAPLTPKLDIMLEAKKKDESLIKLMDEIRGEAGVNVLGQASFKL